MLSYTIFGESHGPAIGVTLTGVPPGMHHHQRTKLNASFEMFMIQYT